MASFESQRAAFKKLHESGCFVIPNPWDVGSATYLQHVGFKAVATTSSGFAYSKGLADSPLSLTRDLVVTHVAELAAALSIPVNVDFQSGYGEGPADVAESVRQCVEAGASGLSIEDSTGLSDKPLYEVSEALDRLRAAREAIDKSGTGVLLTARSECFLTGHPDPLNESLRRIQAYSEAGADVLFVPAPAKREIISAIVEAAGGKPVNVIVSANTGLTVSDIAALGARRISVGSALARGAWAGFIAAVKPLVEEGSFAGLDGATPFPFMKELFG